MSWTLQDDKSLPEKAASTHSGWQGVNEKGTGEGKRAQDPAFQKELDPRGRPPHP